MIDLILLPSVIVFVLATLASIYLSVLLLANWKCAIWDIGYGFTLNTEKNIAEALAPKHREIGVCLFLFRRSMLRILFRLFPVSLLVIVLLWLLGVVDI